MKPSNLLLCLFISAANFCAAQDEIVHAESVTVNQNDHFQLTIHGERVTVLQSPDDKLHFETVVNFYRYPKRKRDDVRKQRILTIDKSGDEIVAKNNKRVARGLRSLYRTINLGRIPEKEVVEKRPMTEFEETLNDNFNYRSWFEIFNYSFGLSNREGNDELMERHFRRKKSFERSLVVKIPKGLKVTIASDFGQFLMPENLINHFKIRLNEGRLVASALNANDDIKCYKARVYVDDFNGAKLDLNNSKAAMIASLNGGTINAEFSNLEVGKVNAAAEIKGFNNTVSIHDFSSAQEPLKLKSEYSKIIIFESKQLDRLSVSSDSKVAIYRDDRRLDFQGDGTQIDFGRTKKSGTIDMDSHNDIIMVGKEQVKMVKQP